MHGLGNDFVIINISENKYSQIIKNTSFIKKICDRKIGIGCDQLILIENTSSEEEWNKCTMIIYNQDGSYATACGNAVRCVAFMLYTLSGNSSSIIKIDNRMIETHVVSIDNKPLINQFMDLQDISNASVAEVKVSMGRYQYDSVIYKGRQYYYANVGNEHLIMFYNDFIQNAEEFFHQDFSSLKFISEEYNQNGINVSVAYIVDRSNILARTYERGVGETSACGTAACAIQAVGHNLNMVNIASTIYFRNGSLNISLHEDNIIMIGSASLVFKGYYLVV